MAASSPAASHNAEKDCRVLHTQLGNATFEAAFGTNHNKSNAFGKCVSAQAKLSGEVQRKAIVNAAKTCKVERA